MRLPQVTEQVRLAPVRALRAMLSGVGQLLLAADRFRAEDSGPRPESGEAQDPLTVADHEVRPAGDDREPAGPSGQARWRSLDSTGNVRVLTRADLAAREAAAEPAPAPAGPPAARAPSAPGPAGPPVPGYDELSVASLRARLRTLDAARLRELTDYERAHANRADIVAMFERRIAKLAAAPPAGGA